MTRPATHHAVAATLAALATLAIAPPFAAPLSQNAFAAGAPPQAMSKANVQQLEANPQSLLSDYSAGGLALSARVRALAITDPSAVAALLSVAAAGNDAQKAAIGAGLAEAALVLAKTDPAAAQAIRQAVAQSGIDILTAAFIAASSPPPSTVGDDGSIDSDSTSGGPPVGFPSSSSSSGPPGGGWIFSHAGESGGGVTTTTQSSVSPSRSSL
jgi:hypothetical protein